MKRPAYFSKPSDVEAGRRKDDDCRSRKSGSTNRSRLHATSDGEIAVATVDLPLIDAGTYEAVASDASMKFFPRFRKSKLQVNFVVLVPDPAAPGGTRKITLPRFYNLTSGPEGRARAGANSDYRREWVKITGRRPTRADRLSPAVFKGTLVLVTVRTVTEDFKQDALHDCSQYSIIGAVLGVVAGGGHRD